MTLTITDFIEQVEGVTVEDIPPETRERINDALIELNPDLYGGGGGGDDGSTPLDEIQGSLQDGSVNELGAAISSSGSTALLGAPGSDVGSGEDEGVALVFERNGDTFEQVAALTASQPGDRVGESVDVEGDTAVVGAPGTGSPPAGEVYVYKRSNGSWNTSPQIALSDADNLQDTGPGDEQEPDLNPQPPSNPADPAFGAVLAIEDDTIVSLGRPGGFSATGLLQFRPRESGDPSISSSGPDSEWVYIDQFVDLVLPTDVATDGGLSLLTSADGSDQVARVFPVGVSPLFERFGPNQRSLSAIPGFGAVGDITNTSGADPVAYVGAIDQVLAYEGTRRNQSNFPPDFPNSATATLTPSTGATGVGFGTSSLAADAGDVVVGAPLEGSGGVVYQFERSGSTWNQVNRITAPTGVTSFGVNLSLAPNTVYVGDGSTVYSYNR